MSLQARCIGIADIFEAQAAKDQPYKKGNTFTDSLMILGKFKLKGHIDPDLYDVFMWEKVYEKYARQFMDPAQTDQVEPGNIPGCTAVRELVFFGQRDYQFFGDSLDEHVVITALFQFPTESVGQPGFLVNAELVFATEGGRFFEKLIDFFLQISQRNTGRSRLRPVCGGA
jgi:hypothetical protein